MKQLRSWLILLVLLAVLGYYLVRGAGRGQFEALGVALGPVAFLEVKNREGRFDGSVVARNVQLIANRQHHLRQLYFESIEMQTPGVWHLLSTPFGTPERLPEKFAVAFNGVRGVPLPLEDEAGNVWLNFKSLVPFDGLACRDSGELLESDFGGMQMAAGQVNVGIRFDADVGVHTVEFTWDNGSFAQLQVKLELESFALSDWLRRGLQPGDTAVRSLTAELQVGDYPVKRNAYCAKLRNQTVEQFVESNLALTREFLNSHGVTVEDRLWQAWRTFSMQGGTISLRSGYGNALRLARLKDTALSDRFELLKLRINFGGGDIPLRFQDFILPTLEISAVAPPLDPKQGEVEPIELMELAAPASNDPLAGVTTGKSNDDRLKPKAGVAEAMPQPKVEPVRRGPRELDYSELSAYIGRDLIFVLDNGMRYRGRPRVVGADKVRVDVILRGGSANMELSRNRIKRITTM